MDHGADALAIDDGYRIDDPVPLLGLPEWIMSERDPARQRLMCLDWIDERIRAGAAPPVSATSVAVSPSRWKLMFLLIADRHEIIEGRMQTATREPVQPLRVRLATLDGRHLARRAGWPANGAHLRGVKYGQHQLGGKDANELIRRGGELNLYREYGPEFDVDLVEGVRLLDLYGFRIAANRENWLLVERGGPLEPEAARWHEARVAAAQLAPPEIDEKPAARRRA